MPGHVYKDAKGDEYLYVGDLKFGISEDYLRDTGELEIETDDIHLEYGYKHIQVKLTGERKKDMHELGFKGWLEKDIQQKVVKGRFGDNMQHWNIYHFKRASNKSSIKYVSESEALFDLDEMRCTVDVKVEKPITVEQLRKKDKSYDYIACRTKVRVYGSDAQVKDD